MALDAFHSHLRTAEHQYAMSSRIFPVLYFVRIVSVIIFYTVSYCFILFNFPVLYCFIPLIFRDWCDTTRQRKKPEMHMKHIIGKVVYVKFFSFLAS